MTAERGGVQEIVRRERPTSFVPVIFEPVPNTLYGIRYEAYDTQLEDIGFNFGKIREGRENKVLAGQRFLVVGVKEGGIGQAIFNELAVQGGEVLGASRKPVWDSEVTSMIATARNLGAPKASWVQMDITSDESRNRALDQANKRFGPLDGLVIASGYINDKPFWQYTPEELDYLIDVNGKGADQLILSYSKLIQEQGHGRIVLASSVAGPGSPNQGGYPSGKAMFDARTRGLGTEFKGAMAVPVGKEGHIDDASIVSLAIALTDTDLTSNMTGPQQRRARNATASVRNLKSQEIGAAASYLFHPEGSFANGKVIPIAGKDAYEPSIDSSGLLLINDELIEHHKQISTPKTPESRRGVGQNETHNFLQFSDAPEYRNEVRELLEHVFENLPENFVWVDVASGTGLGESLVAELSLKYQKHGTIIGIEPDDFAVREAREKVLGNEYCNVEFVQGYGQHLDVLLQDKVADGTADAISILDAIHEIDEEYKMEVLQKGKAKLKPGTGIFTANSAFTTIAMADAGMKYGRWRKTAVEVAGLERDREYAGPTTVIHKPEDYVGMFEDGLGMEIVYNGVHRVDLSLKAIHGISMYPGFTEGVFEGTKPREGFSAPSEDRKALACILSLDINNIDTLPRDWLRIIAKMPA